MLLRTRAFSLTLTCGLFSVSVASAQTVLQDLMTRHGVELPGRDLERGFDEGVVPTIPVSPGSLATPLAMIASASGSDRIAAVFAFGILAGRSGMGASPGELTAAGQGMTHMMASNDRRSRITGARVSGRVFAAPFAAGVPGPAAPPGLTDALFALLNSSHETEQLAAMDALGLLRERNAVTSLTERYHFYRAGGKRALAGGALEALARIGDPSSIDMVKVLAGDRWADGRDATALAVAFARERLLKDGSIAVIQQALDDRSRRSQAQGYLAELGAPVP